MRRRLRSVFFTSLYVVIVVMVVVIVLEFAARMLGLGDPIIYYNAAWGGLRPLPNQQVTRLEGATVTIDKNGFRTAVPETPGALRILYLGDSVTWGGSSVDDTLLFTEVAADVLRQQGTPAYAMNAGVNGSSLMNQADLYASLQDSADVLVWIFPWGDAVRSYVTAGFLWPPTKKPQFALVEAIDHTVRTYWLPSFRRGGQRAAGDFVHPETPYGYESFFEEVLNDRFQKNLSAFEQAIGTALQNGTPVIVGITPRQDGTMLLPLPPDAEDVLQQLKTRGAHVMDLHQVLNATPSAPALFIDEVHFNAEGHRVMGEAIGATLMVLRR